MPTAQDWYTQQWNTQVAPKYGANKTTPYSDQAYIDKFTSGIKPYFGIGVMQNLNNPDWAKYNLKPDNEIDIFDVAQFATNPGQYGQGLFGYDQSGWNPAYDVNNDAVLNEQDYTSFMADPMGYGKNIFGAAPYFEGAAPAYTPGGSVNVPADAVTSRSRGDLLGKSEDLFNTFSNMRRYEYTPVELPGVQTTFQPGQTQPFAYSADTSALNQALNKAATAALSRRGGLTDEELNATLASPLALLQRQQNQALDLLQNRLADTGSYLSANSPQFAEFAARDVLEPYGLQTQQLISDAVTQNLKNRAAEEESLRNFALGTGQYSTGADLSAEQATQLRNENTRADTMTGLAVDQLKNNLALAKSADDRAGMIQGVRDDLEATMFLQGMTDAERNFWLQEFDRAMQVEQFQATLQHDYDINALQTGTLTDIFGDYFNASNITDLLTQTDDPALSQFVQNNPDADWEEILAWMKSRSTGEYVNERPTRS